MMYINIFSYLFRNDTAKTYSFDTDMGIQMM